VQRLIEDTRTFTTEVILSIEDASGGDITRTPGRVTLCE
jgi:hypothetical protein